MSSPSAGRHRHRCHRRPPLSEDVETSLRRGGYRAFQLSWCRPASNQELRSPARRDRPACSTSGSNGQPPWSLSRRRYTRLGRFRRQHRVRGIDVVQIPTTLLVRSTAPRRQDRPSTPARQEPDWHLPSADPGAGRCRHSWRRCRPGNFWPAMRNGEVRPDRGCRSFSNGWRPTARPSSGATRAIQTEAVIRACAAKAAVVAEDERETAAAPC